MYPKKIRSPYLLLLITLGLFFGLNFIMTNSGRAEIQERNRYSEHFRIEMDVRGDLSLVAWQQSIVQDTLSYFAANAIGDPHLVQANWNMNYCCDEDELYAEGEENTRLFQWWAEFDFAKIGGRNDFLIQLLSSDYLNIEKAEFQRGTLVGIASVNMPIPWMDDESIQMQNIAFNLRSKYG